MKEWNRLPDEIARVMNRIVGDYPADVRVEVNVDGADIIEATLTVIVGGDCKTGHAAGWVAPIVTEVAGVCGGSLQSLQILVVSAHGRELVRVGKEYEIVRTMEGVNLHVH